MEHQIMEVLNSLKKIERELENSQSGYLNTINAAKYIGMSKATLDEWRCKGEGPTYHRVGRRVLYSISDLHDFMSKDKVEALS